MDANTLFNLGFEHWPAFLLSFIPALITLGAIIYFFFNFPSYKINKIYLLFLFSLFAWQINDTLIRMSLSEETARSWDRLLAITWMILIPSSIHFILLLNGRKKLSNNSLLIISLYISAIFFATLQCAG